jgi:hypothetical protein
MKAKSKEVQATFAVSQRWTPSLATKGFTPVATAFLEHYRELNITVAEAMLVVHILSHKWTDAMPFPSLTRLADLMGVSERYVRKMLKSLEGVHYLKRVYRTGTSSTYDLSGLMTALERKVGVAVTAMPAPIMPAPTTSAPTSSGDVFEMLGLVTHMQEAA